MDIERASERKAGRPRMGGRVYAQEDRGEQESSVRRRRPLGARSVRHEDQKDERRDERPPPPVYRQNVERSRAEKTQKKDGSRIFQRRSGEPDEETDRRGKTSATNLKVS